MTHVLTDAQLHLRYAGCVVAGLLIALTPQATLRLVTPDLPASEAPQVVVQTESQTVARIPTRRDGRRVDCTVTIDQARNVWSIVC